MLNFSNTTPVAITLPNGSTIRDEVTMHRLNMGAHEVMATFEKLCETVLSQLIGESAGSALNERRQSELTKDSPHFLSTEDLRKTNLLPECEDYELAYYEAFFERYLKKERCMILSPHYLRSYLHHFALLTF